ncbi:EVE domain-containing protein [bacterium]|nr:EVE domain-containing protein [bacterium]
MAYWLVKSEPHVFSWDDQVKAGPAGEPWTGVRNHQAKLYLMAMKRGDRAFYYHSNADKAVVGVVEVVREAYPDPTADEGSPWVCVDVAAVAPLKAPVTLAAAKADKALAEMVLVKNSRLSVQPVTAAEWKHVCKLGSVKA